MSNEATKQQKTAAAEVFESNKEITAVFVTSDCQCFVRQDSAMEHEKDILGKYPNEDQAPVKIERSAEEKTITAKELIDKINSAQSIEEVNEIVGEDTRKTVLDAQKNKIAELQSAE